jgi:hypothetical protein
LFGGTIYFCRAYIDQNVASNNVYIAQIAAGTGLSNCYVGVYQAIAGGNRLAQTADLSTSFMQTAPPISAPWTFSLTSTVSAMAINTEIWLAMLIGAQTSAPTFVGLSNYGTNLGMSSDYRLWVSTATNNTSLPATVPAIAAAASNAQTIPFIGIGP